jgi:beta-phosphoglucomutase
MTTTHILAFIFDLDGVITDTAEYHYLAWKRLAEEEGIPFTREDNEALRGVSRRESLRRMLKGRPIDEDTAQAWMTRKNGYYVASLDLVTPNDLLPGVRELLTEARAAGIRLGLGSASKNARSVLDRLGVADWFDAVGDGYSVVNSKPAPDLFVWTAGRLNVSPTQAVVFEDAEAGVEAALAGGFHTVGIGASSGTKAPLIVNGLAELTVAGVLAAFAPQSA